MRSLLKLLGKMIGIHFAPDNHTIPILRLGQYNRARGPGFIWVIPLIEQTLSPVKTSIYVGNFHFKEVLSQDHVPFSLKLTILFTFQPNDALKNAASVLVRHGAGLLNLIVEDYASQGLRRLASRHSAYALCKGETLPQIERELTRFLSVTLRPLGITPLKNDGILIKETYFPPEIKAALFEAKHDEAMFQVIQNFPIPEMQDVFMRQLLAKKSRLMMINQSGEASLLPLVSRKPMPKQNGQADLLSQLNLIQ